MSASTRRKIKALPWSGILVDGVGVFIDKRRHDLCITIRGEPIWWFYGRMGPYSGTYYGAEHDFSLLKFLYGYFANSRDYLLELAHNRQSHDQGNIGWGDWVASDENDPYDLVDILLAADRRIALWRLDRLFIITNCSVTRKIIGYRHDEK